jgi:hypothetical protein
LNDTVAMDVTTTGFRSVINDICSLNWASLDRTGITATAWAYYYFSIQFRENLRIAHQLYPYDQALARLVDEECATDNLSPWFGVAQAGEKLDHDEFMRRVLTLSPIDHETRQRVEQAGRTYLSRARAQNDHARAASIASYEDGGLERVFSAMIQCQCWDTPLLEGFRHFLVKHIGFDSNPEQGHGALIRHLVPDERVFTLWAEFYTLLVSSVPHLAEFVTSRDSGRVLAARA